jgi:hypothetical protein
MKARLSNVLLMLSLVGFAVNIGGTFYQMTVIIPEWSNELPLSVSRFFGDGRWAAAQFRFWMHPLTDSGVLFFLAGLIVSWRFPKRRDWMLLTLLILVPVFLSTMLWFVPHGVFPLMRDAGAGMTDSEITTRAESWIFWDKIRFAGILLAFGTALQALATAPLRIEKSAESKITRETNV